MAHSTAVVLPLATKSQNAVIIFSPIFLSLLAVWAQTVLHYLMGECICCLYPARNCSVLLIGFIGTTSSFCRSICHDLRGAQKAMVNMLLVKSNYGWLCLSLKKVDLKTTKDHNLSVSQPSQIATQLSYSFVKPSAWWTESSKKHSISPQQQLYFRKSSVIYSYVLPISLIIFEVVVVAWISFKMWAYLDGVARTRVPQLFKVQKNIEQRSRLVGESSGRTAIAKQTKYWWTYWFDWSASTAHQFGPASPISCLP